MLVISNAKVTVLAAALAATGAVLNSTETPPIAAVLFTVALLFAVVFFAFKMHAEKFTFKFELSKPLSVGLLLAVIPLAIFEYAQFKNEPSRDDLSHFIGRDVIFIATADRNDCAEAGRELVLNSELLLFPLRKKLIGKTALVLPQKSGFLQTLGRDVDPRQQMLRLRVQGRIFVPRKAVPSWDYDKRKRLAMQGIFSICNPDSKSQNGGVELIGAPKDSDVYDSESHVTYLQNQYESSMKSARELMVNTHRKYLPTQLADLLSSMVLGNRAIALPLEITHKFRDVGLSHILAASGFNLTIVTVMSFAICRLITPSVVACNFVCFLSILGFVSLAGPSPSVNRAAVMCSIMLMAKSGQRRCQVLAALALSFLLTVAFDPNCTNDLGLQLSYAATVGIVLGSKALTTHLYAGKTKWKQSLADAVSVVLIAQFSVMPIQLFFFWRAGTMFIPANLLVTPLITPLTMIGFASSTLALIQVPQLQLQTAISCIIAFADAVAFIPLTAMVLMVNAFSSLEAANFTLGPPSAFSVVCYYASFLLLLLALRRHAYERVAKAAFMCTFIALLWRPPAPLVTLANVHGHTIVVNAQQQALDLNAMAQATPSKLAERFAAYSGAKFTPQAFTTGILNSGIHFVQSEKWLMLLVSDTNRVTYQRNAMEILYTARKLQCDRIILIAHRNQLPPADFLPASEYIPIRQEADGQPKDEQSKDEQPKDGQLKFVEMKNMASVQFVRR